MAIDLSDGLKWMPPVTLFLTLSALLVSAAVALGTLPFKLVYFDQQLVFLKFEIWRLYTCFSYGMVAGPFCFLYELVLLHAVSTKLEKGHYVGRSANYVWQLAIASLTTMIITIPLSPGIFWSPRLLAVVTLSAFLAPADEKSSFFGFFIFPVRYFPFVLIFFDLLFKGPRMAELSVAGAIVGYLWWWAVWEGGLPREGRGGRVARWLEIAPGWLHKVFGETKGERGYINLVSGVQVLPPHGGPVPSNPSGHSWGHGQRLGSP